MASILIVDDDPTIRAMFGRALRGLGEPELASNGAEALRLLNTRRYGVVLLDLHMPVTDGFEVLEALASKPGPNRDTPVYVVSADLSDTARVRALRKHAVFFLTKPVPLVALVGLVESSLKKSATRVQAPPKAATAPGASDRTSDAPAERSTFLPGAPPEGAPTRPAPEARITLVGPPPRPTIELGASRGSSPGPAPRADDPRATPTPGRGTSPGPEPRRGSSLPGGTSGRSS